MALLLDADDILPFKAFFCAEDSRNPSKANYTTLTDEYPFGYVPKLLCFNLTEFLQPPPPPAPYGGGYGGYGGDVSDSWPSPPPYPPLPPAPPKSRCKGGSRACGRLACCGPDDTCHAAGEPWIVAVQAVRCRAPSPLAGRSRQWPLSRLQAMAATACAARRAPPSVEGER